MNLLPDFSNLSFLQTAENMNKPAILPSSLNKSVFKRAGMAFTINLFSKRRIHSQSRPLQMVVVFLVVLSLAMVSCKKTAMLKEIDRAYKIPGSEYQMAVAIWEYVHQYFDDEVVMDNFMKYLYEKGYFRECLHLAQSSLHRNPENHKAWFYSGMAFSALYRFPEAEHCFAYLMKNSSDFDVSAAYKKFQIRKRIFTTISSLDSLISLSHSDTLFKNRADLLLKVNEVNAALSDYRYFLNRVGFNADALLNKFRAEMISRQYDSASLTTTWLRQAKEDKQVFSKLEGLVSQARIADEKIFKNPEQPDGYIEKARILLLLRFEQDAIDNLLTAISLKPSDPTLRFKLALAYQVAGQEDKALELMKELQAQGFKLPKELQNKLKLK